MDETKYKSKLIDRISAIKDKDVLDEVYRLLDVDIDETIYQTTPEQREEIKKAQAQLSENKGVPADEANAQIEKWLLK